MREILFKAKRIDNGEWVEGYYLKAKYHWHEHGIHEDWIAVNAIQNGGFCNVCAKYAIDADTLSQYIGLADKNGNKIFENDIVDMNRKGCGFKRIEKVFYEEGGFSPISVHGWECTPEANEIEVIGNIFDNSELLEGGN